MLLIYVLAYVAVGVAFTELRIWLIKRDCIWSVVALIDYADGILDDDAEDKALRNNRWIWLVWPPLVMMEIMLGVLMIGLITSLDGWRDIFGKVDKAVSEPTSNHEWVIDD